MHTDDDEPIIWQLTPQHLQKTWHSIFKAAADLASKERKKDLTNEGGAILQLHEPRIELEFRPDLEAVQQRRARAESGLY